MKKILLLIMVLGYFLFSQAFATVTTVSTSEELSLHLSTVNAGDTIILESGNYGDISLNNKNFTSDVIIRSSDDSNKAVIEKITLNNSGNIVFDGIDFSHTKRANEREWSAFIKISNSDNISIKNSHISGSDNLNLADDTWGILAYNNSDLLFSGNEFSNLVKSFIAYSNDNLQIVNNRFSDISKSAIEIGKNSTDTTISHNSFSDFYRCNFVNITNCSQYGIAISLWNTGGTQFILDTTIDSNTFLIGSGSAAQFIVANSNNGSFPIKNLTISNNLNYNNHINGIVLVNVESASITYNTNIQANISTYNLDMSITKPYIRIISDRGTIVSNNTTMGIIGLDNGNSIDSNNILALNNDDSELYSYNSLFVNAREGRSVIVKDFDSVEGSASENNSFVYSEYQQDNNESTISNTGYDIFLVAGQSNTHYGIGDTSTITVPQKVYQWGRFYPNNNKVAVATVPLEHWTRNVEKAGFAIPFINHYIDNSMLIGDREVLLIPAGYGNSGFSNSFWNKGDTAYEDAVSRVNLALNSKEGSVMKGILWLQGEYDASHGSDYETYKTALHTMIVDMKSDINGEQSSLPFVIGGMAPNWVDDNQSVYERVENVHKDTPGIVNYTGFADPYNPTRITSMSDNLHYSLEGQIEMGERFYIAYLEALENN